MILFFDRNLGTAIPKALREFLKPPGLQVEIHQDHFDQLAQDDVWLQQVGQWGWFVVTQDYSYHERATELAAIRTHNVGAFYLWGSEAHRWESFRAFAAGYDRLVRVTEIRERPFIFRIERHGGLTTIHF